MVHLTALSQELAVIARYNDEGIIEYPFVF